MTSRRQPPMVSRMILNDLRARADRADFGLLDNDFPLADLREQWLRHLSTTRATP